jgi:hypothetical protein
MDVPIGGQPEAMGQLARQDLWDVTIVEVCRRLQA